MKKVNVLIIWWWPSWSTAGIMLRKYWYDVSIIDKWFFPKHTVWESLLPIVTSDYMKVIWLDEEIKKQWFPKKYGTTFVWWNSRKPWNLFFDKDLETDKLKFTTNEKEKIISWNYTHSYQVNRYIFDKLFVDKAKKDWVSFKEGIAIKDLIINDWKIEGVVLYNWESIYTDFIVDASWQEAILWTKLWLRKFNKELWFSAIYWYFKNFNFLDTFLSKHTQYIVSVDSWWVWFIYTWNWIVSIWLVSSKKNLTKKDFFDTMKNTKELSFIFDKNTVQTNHLWEISNDFYKSRNRSYFNDKIYWENYLMIWDAAGFVDPVLSWWVSIALMSWIISAPYIDKFLKYKDISVFKKYQDIIFYDINNYYELAKYWYWNNNNMNSWFWKANKILWLDISNKFNKRAFTFLASWAYYTREHLNDSNELRIRDYTYDSEDIDEIQHLVSDESIIYIKIREVLNNINSDLSEDQFKKNIYYLFKNLNYFLGKISTFDREMWRALREVFLLNKINFLKFFFDEKNFLLIKDSIKNLKINKNFILSLFSYIIYILWKCEGNNTEGYKINMYLRECLLLPKSFQIFNKVVVWFGKLSSQKISNIFIEWGNIVKINWESYKISDFTILYDSYLE